MLRFDTANYPLWKDQVHDSGDDSTHLLIMISGNLLAMSINTILKHWARRTGFDIIRFNPDSHPLARRKKLLESYKIDLVLDVGANTGQFALEMRQELRYAGRIVSFEPLSSAFRGLKENIDQDASWRAFNYALGDHSGQYEINIAGNSYSSSLLDMLPSHEMSAPDSKYVGKETIEVHTLDSIFDSISIGANNIYLKIDTQGFEGQVIKGAINSLPRIGTIQLEISLIPLYEGGVSFEEIYRKLTDYGYVLVSIEPGFSDQSTGQLLQIDGTFHRFHEAVSFR